MTKELKQIRNNLCYQIWEQYKNRWSMLDLALVFNMPLPTFFKIIRKIKYEKNNLATNTDK